MSKSVASSEIAVESTTPGESSHGASQVPSLGTVCSASGRRELAAS